MANLPAGGGGGPSRVKPVEIVPINGGSSIKVGPTDFPGVTSASQSGGVNTPTKRTEQGYDYTTRVNREAREAFQAKAGTSNIEALTVSGKKTGGSGGLLGHGGLLGTGYNVNISDANKSSGKATGNTNE